MVLVSVGLPEHGALALTRTLVDNLPAVKVLALGLLEEDKEDTLRYIEAGAAGYISKNSSLDEFTRVIRLAQKGEAQVSTKIAGAMMERLSALARMFSAVENKINGDARLTTRELEVLQFIGEGLTNQEIGERLFLALDTVKGHNRRIFGKLQVQRRTEAIARARELGLL